MKEDQLNSYHLVKNQQEKNYRRLYSMQNHTIRRENIKYTADPFKKIVSHVLNKYNLKSLNTDTVDLSRNFLKVNVVIELPQTRTVSTSGMMSILRNEIAEKIFYFSAIKPKTIQIVLGTEE
jgi:hypothetical protein